MMPSQFRELAKIHFGDDYIKEIARHYGKTVRAVRYYETGEVSPAYDVTVDLLRWSEPGGWKARMVAKIRRAMADSIPEPEMALEAYEHLTSWTFDMQKLQNDLKRFRDREREEEESTRLEVEHALGVRKDARLFNWFLSDAGPVKPLRALTASENIAIRYAADSWVFSR